MNEPPDILLLTDGSGYKDGYGGYAAVAATPDGVWKFFRMGAASGTTVDRMEFTALLEGLQLAWEMWNAMPVSAQEPPIKPRVRWLSDRENIVLSARSVQERSNCPDLWCRYAYYEERMEIRPQFIDREEEANLPDFKMVDLQSSVGREILKNYLATLILPKAQLPGTYY